MKKLFATLLALIVAALPLTALAEGNWYIEESTDLVRRIHELTLDENYCSIYTVGNEAVNTWLEKIRAADYDAPVSAKAVYVGEKDALLDLLSRALPMTGDDSFDTLLSLSDTAKDEFVKKLPAALANLVNSRLGGTEWLMMGSMINTGRGYVEPDGFRPCVLMLEYPGQCEAFVTFQRTGEGVVGASATLVPTGAAAFVDEYIGQLAARGIEVETEELL